MADVVIRVTGQDSSKPATDAAADGIERIGDEAKKTSPKLTELGASARGAGRGANEMGDQFDKSKHDAEQLRNKLIELKATTVTLGQSFAASGGKDMAVLKEFTKATTELGKTRRVPSPLDIDDPTLKDAGKRAASTFSSEFQGGVLDTMRALPSEAKLVIGGTAAAVGAVFAVGVIESVNALLLAGLGVGGLVAGIKLAARDPEVAGAYSELGTKILDRLDKSVEPFKGKLIDSADLFGDAFMKQAPRIDTIFAGLAEEVKPLATGAAKGFENLMPGLERGLAASKPLLRDLATELPRLGTLIGQLFDSLANAGPGLELTFRTILISIEALIKSFQIMVDLAAPIPNLIAAIGDKLGAWDIEGADGLVTVLTDISGAATDGGHSFDDLSSQMYNTADAAKQLDDQFRSLFDVMLSQDKANLKVKQGWADLSKELGNGKRTLDENTQAGRDNVGAILEQIRALDGKREADIAAGNGTLEATQTANAAYAGQIESLRRLLLQMGFTKEEVQSLIEKYAQIPSEINTTINTFHNDYYARQGASGSAFDPGSRLDRRGIGDRMFGGPVGAARSGGIYSGMTKVGEGGYEYARLPLGTMMYPHANSAQMDAMAGQQASGGVTTVALVASGGTSDPLVELINNLIRTGRLGLRVVNNRVVPQ